MLDPAGSRSVQPLDSNAPPSTLKPAPAVRRRAGRSMLLEATLPSPAVLYVQSTVPAAAFRKGAYNAYRRASSDRVANSTDRSQNEDNYNYRIRFSNMDVEQRCSASLGA
jgi:hypothetical protein